MYQLMTRGDAPQLHVDRPGYVNPCRCQLCQTLGGIYQIVTVEDSMKKKSGSLSKAMGMLLPCNLPAAIIVVIQYSGRLRY